MILVDEPIEHCEERVAADNENNCDAYCHQRAKELNKKRVVYFAEEYNYRSFMDRNFKIDKTDLLVFSGPNGEIILVWDS